MQALHELKRERENGQALDRLRLVHREVPAQVYVLGSLVLEDVPVDRLADSTTCWWRWVLPPRSAGMAGCCRSAPTGSWRTSRACWS